MTAEPVTGNLCHLSGKAVHVVARGADVQHPEDAVEDGAWHEVRRSKAARYRTSHGGTDLWLWV